MKQGLDRLKNSGNQAGNALSGIGTKALDASKGAAAQLAGIESALAALQTFAQQLIAEIEIVKKKQSAAGQALVGIVPSLDAATQNSGDTLASPQILNMAKKTAPEAGRTASKVLDTFRATWAAAVTQGDGATVLKYMAVAASVQAGLNWPFYTMADDSRANRRLLEQIAKK